MIAARSRLMRAQLNSRQEIAHVFHGCPPEKIPVRPFP